MANPLAPRLPLPKGQQLAVAIGELQRENPDSYVDSLPPADRKDTFGIPRGMISPPSPESEGSDFVMRSVLSPEPKDESGKHTLYSTG